MNAETNGDVRFLKSAALALAVLLVATSVVIFQRTTHEPRFEELEVERINIIEPDGTPRLILYSSSHTPGAILRGKEHPHPNRGPHAGILYFNDEGTENGGSLTFDQFDQDQVVSLGGGLRVWDQPYIPMEQVVARVQAARTLPEGPERTRALEEVNAWALSQGIFTQRLMVGTTRDNAAMVELADSQRRPRLRVVVNAGGDGRLDFLGESGQVTRSITAAESSGH